MTLLSLPDTDAVQAEGWRLLRAQKALRRSGGISQITSWPDRRWVLRLNVTPQKISSSGIRLWSLFVNQLSDMENHFAYGPPHYSGPSTGYAGSNPLVNGADQLGLALAVDGLPATTAILLAGDWFSVDTTSPVESATNRQLNQVTADVTSNASGEATLPLLLPLRQAPLNNASVNVLTPTAFFRASDPEALLELDVNQFSPFVIDAEEQVFP